MKPYFEIFGEKGFKGGEFSFALAFLKHDGRIGFVFMFYKTVMEIGVKEK